VSHDAARCESARYLQSADDGHVRSARAPEVEKIVEAAPMRMPFSIPSASTATNVRISAAASALL